MSYSTCFVCGDYVSGYEKYCRRCLKKHKLVQGDWRTFTPKTEHETPERKQEILDEIARDKKPKRRLR